jgi:Ca2+-binding RTX toxin-like protein
MTAAQNITELFNGYKFTSTTITYSFLTEYAPYTSQGIQEPGGPTLLTDAQKDATRQLFADIQSFLGVQFVEVIQDNSQNQIGQIAIGMRGNMPDLFVGDALPPYSNGAGEAGDIWIKAGHGGGAATDEFVATMLHEICHALGLRHPTFSDVQKTRRYTVDSTDQSLPAPTKLQLYDISALQYLYGAATSRHPGNTVYSYSSGNPMESIWDTGGNDTITAAGRSASVIINLNQTSFSSIGFAANNLENPSNNISIAKGAVIENATGGNGADLLIGNATANTLTGNSGDDFIFGDEVAARAFFGPAGSSVTIREIFWDTEFLYVGAYQTAGTDSTTDNDTIDAGAGADWVFAGKGADKVDGGAGNDFLDGGDQTDEMAYNGISGNVQIQKLAPSAVPDDIADNGQSVFQITVQRNGTSETDKIRGFESVSFGDGSQKFKYDFTLGDDSLLLDGGAGIDSFDFSSASTSITIYTGPVNGEENSVLPGSGVSFKNFEAFVGSAQNDVFWFNEGDQLLYGRGGDDYLVGGAGNDVLEGGEDDDILTGGDGADKFILGDGLDLIMDADADDRLFVRLPAIGGGGSGDIIVPILGGFFENTPWDPGPHGTTIGDAAAIFKPRDVIWGGPDAPLYQSLGADFEISFSLYDADLYIDVLTQGGQQVFSAIVVGYEPGALGLVFEEKISPYQVDGVRSWFDEVEPTWEAAHKALLNNGVFGSIQQASDFII